jgi:hypothetical protein
VIRTGFLLRYISDSQLRSTIQGATNKSEALNRFLKWAFFGGEGIIAENSRDEQRKAIKYNHLVANCLIFHNLCSLTRLVQTLERRGETVPEDAIAAISPLPHGAHQPFRRLHPQPRQEATSTRLRLHSETDRFSSMRTKWPILYRIVAIPQVRFFTVRWSCFNDVVEIFALPQTNSAGERTLGFQGFHCRRIGRVLIHVDDPRNGVGG